MRTYTVKPLGMDCKNNVFYPMGLPTEDDPEETFDFAEYYDSFGDKYAICYTKKQVQEALHGKTLFCFSPYIPLFISELYENTSSISRKIE